MSTAATACILVIDLSGEKLRVLRRFDHHRLPHSVVQERVVKGRIGDGVGDIDIDVDVDVDVDVDMADTPVDSVDKGRRRASTSVMVNVLRISISPDGQWLATSDDFSRTHVFNLDSIQVHPFFYTMTVCLIVVPAASLRTSFVFKTSSSSVF
jgi:U3 small nucleolar RNA-associated protein 4